MGITVASLHEFSLETENPRRVNPDGIADAGNSIRRTLSERSLNIEVRLACKEEGIAFERLGPIQRLFVTHYRCPICRLLPLSYVNIAHPKRVRCGKCGNLIPFRNSGKYGKIRKKIALKLHHEVSFYYLSQ